MRVRLAIALPLDNSDSRSTTLRSGRDDKGVFVNSYELQLSVSATSPGLVIKSEAEGPAVPFLFSEFSRSH
jgi:hypothetical protein